MDISSLSQVDRQFWQSFAEIVAALAGFTIAGYSIYTARAWSAEADERCANFSFREVSSDSSRVFFFFVLLLFSYPLLLSLLILMPLCCVHTSLIWTGRFAAPFLTLVLEIPVLYMVWKQGYYSLRAERGGHALDKLASTLPKQRFISQNESEGQQRDGDIQVYDKLIEDELNNLFQNMEVQYRLRIHLYAFLALFGMLALSGCIVNIVVVLENTRLWETPVWLMNLSGFFPPQLAGVASLGTGVSLLFFQFLLYSPERTLFTVDSSTVRVLQRVASEIARACDELETLVKSLSHQLTNSDSRWISRFQDERRIEGSEDRFNSTTVQQQRLFFDPEIAEKVDLLALRYYHFSRLRFLEKTQDKAFVTYDAIVGITSGIEQYRKGLKALEAELRSTQAELQALIRFVDIHSAILESRSTTTARHTGIWTHIRNIVLRRPI